MKTHRLKLNMEFCDDVLSGKKSFEVRLNDRGFQTGDLIKFQPYDGRYSVDVEGNKRYPCRHEIEKHIYRITYILNGWGLKNNYVALAIKRED